MISCIKNNEFEVILIYRLNRLVRSVMNLYELLTLFDTASAMGRFFITLVGARLDGNVKTLVSVYKWRDYESEIEYRNDLNELKEKSLN